MDKKPHIATQGVRAGQVRSQFQEHAEALYLTSSYVFDDAAQAAERFGGGEGMVYTRYTNPTVAMFQDRLAALEGGESCVATGSGMAAILATAMTHLKAGDHVVCSNAVFGATIQLFSTLLGRFGVETSYVSPTKIKEWEQAVRKNTRLLFLETPSNPLTEISDLEKISTIAKQAGALLAVDNVFCTPALQRPLELGADLVVHSATKYIDGQGRVMGGAVVGSKALVGEPMTVFLRTAGPTLSPFNAWVLLKGLETLDLRIGASGGRARLLSRPGVPSAARARQAPAERQRRHRLVRCEGRPRRSVAGHRLDAARVDHREPRRREDHHHASREYHARAHLARSARRGRDRRRTDPPVGRT